MKKIQKTWSLQKVPKKIVDLLKVSKQTNYKKYFEENRKTVKLSGTTLIKLYIQSMVISTNRPGHRETDLSDWGSTF